MKDQQNKSVVRTFVSLQAVKIPEPHSDPKQLVVRRSVKWKEAKEFTEMQAAQNLLRFTERQSWKLKTEKDEPVDITVRSPDEGSTEDFQIVRLWTDIWRDLSKMGAVDRCCNDAEAVEQFRRMSLINLLAPRVTKPCG